MNYRFHDCERCGGALYENCDEMGVIWTCINCGGDDIGTGFNNPDLPTPPEKRKPRMPTSINNYINSAARSYKSWWGNNRYLIRDMLVTGMSVSEVAKRRKRNLRSVRRAWEVFSDVQATLDPDDKLKVITELKTLSDVST